MSPSNEIISIRVFHNPPERFNSYAEMRDFIMQRSSGADELKEGVEQAYAVLQGAHVERNVVLSQEEFKKLKLSRDSSKQ